MKSNEFVIAVESPMVGAGKTTLCDNLMKNCKDITGYLCEPVNLGLMPELNEIKSKKAFLFQMDILQRRMDAQVNLKWYMNSKFILSDRTVYGDLVFADIMNEEGKISNKDYKRYKKFFDVVENFSVKPSLVIQLDVSVNAALRNIKKRGREFEQSIDGHDLERLKYGYKKLVWPKIDKLHVPVIRFNWDEPQTENAIKEVQYWIKRRVNG